MKRLPVLALDSFAARGYYLERLETHVVAHPHVNVPHAHDFYLLLYVTQGSGTHTIDLIPYPLGPGSLFLMTPGQVHGWQLSADAQGYVLFFDAEFYLARFPGPRLLDYPFFAPGGAPALPLPWPDPELLPLFERMWAELLTPAPNQAEVFRAYLFLVLELAARREPGAASAGLSASRQHLRAFSQLLNQHFRRQHTVQFYAGELHLTPNHLNAVCQQVLHKTARTLIQERLLAEAERLLTQSELSVKQIADELGFDDASYFGRFYRQHRGQPPAAFRQSR